MPDPVDAFVSHTHRDEALIRRLCDELTAHGLTLWVDHADIMAGSSWMGEIDRALEAASAMLLCVGPHDVSKRMYDEYEAYRQSDRRDRVIPVLLPGAPDIQQLRLSVRRHHCIDLRDQGAWATGLEALVAAVRGDAERHRFEREREALRRARKAYVERVLDLHAHRRPLRDVLYSLGGTGADLTMSSVEHPVHIALDLRGQGAITEQPHLLASLLQERMDDGERPTLTVQGDMGTGKTTLLEQAAAPLARRAESSLDAPLPLLVAATDLPTLDQRQVGRFHEWRPDALLLARDDVHWVILVDGYDEVSDAHRGAVDLALRRLSRDPRTAALVVTSRPVAEPRIGGLRDHYRIVPWTLVDGVRFMHNWGRLNDQPIPSTSDRARSSLLTNPLTATLYLVCAERVGEDPTLAQLFDVVVEWLFDAWARSRKGALPVRWSEVATVYRHLARGLLESDASSFSWSDVQRALSSAESNASLGHLHGAEKLGLLARRPDDTYEFILRPIAEHLAGASMLDTDAAEVCRIATGRWAEEPVRHCVGLHAWHRRYDRAFELLRALARIPTDEIETVHALRTATIATRAASDLDELPEEIAKAIAVAILVPLIDGSSRWRPARAEVVVRSTVERGGPMGRALVDHSAGLLQTPADDLAVHYVEPSLRGLYHCEASVRVLTMRRLASGDSVRELRWLFFAMLSDCGHGSPDLWSVAAEAGLALRALPRDEAFFELLPPLRHLLQSHGQIAAGAAAIALHPHEADATELAEALSAFANGFGVPPVVLDELRRTEAGAAALAALRREIGPNKLVSPPTTEELEERASPQLIGPSLYVRSHITRALRSSLFALDEAARQDCIERARNGGALELEVLCGIAISDPSMVLDLMKQTADEFRPGLIDRERPYLTFTPRAGELLEIASYYHPQLRDGLVDLWARTSAGYRPFSRFPGRVLEANLSPNAPGVVEAYAQWLPTTYHGMEEPPSVPLEARALPVVRDMAEALVRSLFEQAFEGREQDGKRTFLAPQTTSLLLSRLRPFWARDSARLERLQSWLRDGSNEEFRAAVRALGPEHQPASVPETMSARIVEAIENADDSGQRLELVNLIVGSAHVELSSECLERLHQLAVSDHLARFAAGYILCLDGEPERARALSTTLSKTWPNLNWGFYYSRHDEVLRTLVKAAPEAWAECAMGSGAWGGLELGTLLLQRLQSSDRARLIEAVLRAARATSLPWHMLLGSFGATRLLDAVLELVYESGVDEATVRGWLGDDG